MCKKALFHPLGLDQKGKSGGSTALCALHQQLCSTSVVGREDLWGFWLTWLLMDFPVSSPRSTYKICPWRQDQWANPRACFVS